MVTDSLSKRYLFKLGTGLIGVPMGLITQIIVPRSLGPAGYGSFSYIFTSFSQIFSLFESGTSTAFYTKLSQRPEDEGLKRFYWRFFQFVIFIVLLILLIIVLTHSESLLWPDQNSEYLIFGFMVAALTWASHITNQMVDAYGLTVQGEIVNVCQKLVSVFLLVVLFFEGILTLRIFFLQQQFILLCLIIGFSFVLRGRNISVNPRRVLDKEQVLSYGKEFYKYSAPLLVYSIVGMSVNLFDRWFLQYIYGSVEQGYFGLAYQMNGFCILFASAMLPLFMREMSVASGNREKEKMADLFERIIPLIYIVTVYFTVFLSVQASKIAVLIGGGAYTKASLPISIMVLYTLPQTYGQLSGSVFFACNQTKLYRNIGIIFFVIGFVVTYFLLAPRQYYGLNAGATGLAIKFVAVSFLAVSTQLWFNAKLLGISFYKYFFLQIYSILILFILAFPIMMLSDYIIGNMILSLLVSGFIYTFLFLLVFYLYPAIFLVKKSEIHRMIENIVSLRIR
jgi:O-antigen/teichoic acid export membrane protein